MALRRGRFTEAAALFERVPRLYPDSGFAPDALYWAAIAEYMTTNDTAVLEERRLELKRRYPDSLAARKV